MARPKGDVKKRFLDKVNVSQSGCHEWISVLHRDGYGKFYFDGKQVASHIVSYKLFVGEVPKGMWVLHKCDNRKCVNPEHLFLGDSIANIKDMDKKGRRGTRSNLTESQVDEIKKLLSKRVTQQEIANIFGVHQTTISKIKLGKTTIFRKD